MLSVVGLQSSRVPRLLAHNPHEKYVKEAAKTENIIEFSHPNSANTPSHDPPAEPIHFHFEISSLARSLSFTFSCENKESCRR